MNQHKINKTTQDKKNNRRIYISIIYHKINNSKNDTKQKNSTNYETYQTYHSITYNNITLNKIIQHITTQNDTTPNQHKKVNKSIIYHNTKEYKNCSKHIRYTTHHVSIHQTNRVQTDTNYDITLYNR